MTALDTRPIDLVDGSIPAPEPRPAAVPFVREKRRSTRLRTRDDNLTLVAAALGSLALTWLLYERVLPLSGKIGFFVAWFAVFVAFYAGLTALTQPLSVVVDRVASTMVIAAPTLIGIALASTVIFIAAKGFSALVHVNLYTSDQSGVRPDAPLDQGGILHAIVGTLIEVGIAVGIALPLGVATAVYMAEVGGRFARIVRTIVEAMTALPSVVAGLFIYTTVVVGHFHWGRSGFAAALALSIMGLPIMARASDVVLRIVPGGLREASYALGASRVQTIWRVVLPTARPGLATALILGIARMVGETSPLLLTSGPSTYMNKNPFKDPMNSLPLYAFNGVTSGEPRFEARGYAAAAVLLIIVLILFLTARLIARGRTGQR